MGNWARRTRGGRSSNRHDFMSYYWPNPNINPEAELMFSALGNNVNTALRSGIRRDAEGNGNVFALNRIPTMR